MQCSRRNDDELAGQMMELLYGEADAEVRARVEAHLGECAACREEMAALGRVRRSLRAWTLEGARGAGKIVPARGVSPWLAAAAGLLLGLGVGVASASLGDASVRRDMVAQEGRALEREGRHREAVAGLRAALAARPPEDDGGALLGLVDERLDEALRRSLGAQDARMEAMFTEWSDQVEAQRRVDLARVAAGLSYLDGQHGQQVARTNELMGYVLNTASEEPR